MAEGISREKVLEMLCSPSVEERLALLKVLPSPVVSLLRPDDASVFISAYRAESDYWVRERFWSVACQLVNTLLPESLEYATFIREAFRDPKSPEWLRGSFVDAIRELNKHKGSVYEPNDTWAVIALILRDAIESNSDGDRWGAAEALGVLRIQADWVETTLLRLLNDSNDTVVAKAADSFSMLGYGSCEVAEKLMALIDRFGGRCAFSTYAARALAKAPQTLHAKVASSLAKAFKESWQGGDSVRWMAYYCLETIAKLPPEVSRPCITSLEGYLMNLPNKFSSSHYEETIDNVRQALAKL